MNYVLDFSFSMELYSIKAFKEKTFFKKIFKLSPF